MLDTKLIAFLEGKPSTEQYDYEDWARCAAAQFNRSIWRRYEYQSDDWRSGKTFDNRLERIAREQPRTFGALLTRARKEFA